MTSDRFKATGFPILLLLLLAATGKVFGQGFIIPRPVPPHRYVMPQLTEHRVDARIVDQVAQVRVQQVFYNDSKQVIAGDYYFPLPKGASVSDFKMYADGKVLTGKLLDKAEARRIYFDIVRRQLDPALLEYVGHNLFSAKIFPIPPKKERAGIYCPVAA